MCWLGTAYGDKTTMATMETEVYVESVILEN